MSKNQKLKSYIVYDHFLKTKVDCRYNLNMVKGVIYVKGLDLVFGYFSKSFLNCIIYYKGQEHIAINRSIFNEEDGFLSYDDGVVRHKSEVKLDTDYYTNVGDFKYNLDYSVSSENIETKNKTLSCINVNVFDNVKMLCKELRDLSVGVEIETIKGFVPFDLLHTSNLIPLRDGSIAGLEYVTTPMFTDKDFQIFFNSVQKLKSYTTVNNSCALHFHFGNVERTESFITALWVLMSIIQNDIYQHYMPYKMLNWGYKNKAYSKPLDTRIIAQMNPVNSVSSNFKLIFDHLCSVSTYENYDSDLKNVHSHPCDPDNEHKWNIKERYSIINFIPLIFTNKKTVEFRISEPTLNVNEIALEMLLFAKIINFAKDNEKKLSSLDQDFLRNLNLYSVIKGRYRDSLSSYLKIKQDVVFYNYRNGDVDFKLDERYINSNIVTTSVDFSILDRLYLTEEYKYNLTSWRKPEPEYTDSDEDDQFEYDD